SGPVAVLDLRIKSRLNSRQRRLIGVTLMRALSPWLRYFSEYTVDMDRPRLPRERTVSQNGFEIRMRRLKAGLTQAELASLTGIHTSSLCAIESGTSQPHRSTLQRIEAALGGHRIL